MIVRLSVSGVTVGLGMFAMPEVETFCFLEFVLLTTRQREADQPYRKENLTQKFHGHPFNRGNAALQLPSSHTRRDRCLFSATAATPRHHDATAFVLYHLHRLAARDELAL